MSSDDFFNESLEQSRIKAQIVKDYFTKWSWIMISTTKKRTPHYRAEQIAYIDLFAGPGLYKDRTKSTPILILEEAIKDQDTREMLVTLFNDSEPNNTQALKQAISEIPNATLLKHKPVIMNKDVDDDIVEEFERFRFVPTLLFVDPWGYKGLSLRLIKSVIKDWGCDCIFFFNYNRISMALLNEKVEPHMNALFGIDQVSLLRGDLRAMQSSEEREHSILGALKQALAGMGGEFVRPFRFRNDTDRRTSHYLIFVSKSFKGYDEMKKIMAKYSSEANEGVPTFEYNPVSSRQPMLLAFRPTPLNDLKLSLVSVFSGQTLTMEEIYKRHSINTDYIIGNYKKALQELEIEGKITADPPASKRRKNTFGDDVRVRFPK